MGATLERLKPYEHRDFPTFRRDFSLGAIRARIAEAYIHECPIVA